MHLSHRGRVVSDAVVRVRVVVRLGRVVGVVGDIGLCLALLGHAEGGKVSARLLIMIDRLRERKQED